jgi:alkaline phosphatase D
VRYWPAGQPGEAQLAHAIELSMDHDFTGSLQLVGLEADSNYEYAVQLEPKNSTCVTTPSKSSVRRFRTLPQTGRIRFVTAGDVDGSDVPGFGDIAKVNPAFVVMLGDSVYADGFGDTFEAYQKRYWSVWSGKQFEDLFSTVAAFRILDDHEIVDNYWNGKNDAVYRFARSLYDDYQGSMNPEPLVNGELFYTFAAGDVSFFVLDTRTHRSPNDAPDGPNKSMLGAQQKQALKDWLANDHGRVHVIISTVLVSRFSTTGDDSWISFLIERNEILAAIHDMDTPNVMVISGDQHWSAVLRTDYGTPSAYSIYEFQTTPLAFSERGAPTGPDSTVTALDNTHRVFGVFDLDTRVDPPTVDFTLCAVGAPCSPGQEPLPATRGATTNVPYHLQLKGGAHGFHMESIL